MVDGMNRWPAAGARLLACAVLALAAGGCGTENVRQLADTADFHQAIQSPQPVMVDFYKGGCPTCVALDGTINQLAAEYRGRAVVARFELMKPYFAITSEEIKTKYDIGMYPTVILFVNGQEKARWALDYNVDHYRKALNEVLGRPAPAEPPSGGPAAP